MYGYKKSGETAIAQMMADKISKTSRKSSLDKIENDPVSMLKIAMVADNADKKLNIIYSILREQCTVDQAGEALY